jgi:hypothetical protein
MGLNPISPLDHLTFSLDCLKWDLMDLMETRSIIFLKTSLSINTTQITQWQLSLSKTLNKTASGGAQWVGDISLLERLSLQRLILMSFLLLVSTNGFHTEDITWSMSLKDGLMIELVQCKFLILTELVMKVGKTFGAFGTDLHLELEKLSKESPKDGNTSENIIILMILMTGLPTLKK